MYKIFSEIQKRKKKFSANNFHEIDILAYCPAHCPALVSMVMRRLHVVYTCETIEITELIYCVVNELPKWYKPITADSSSGCPQFISY